MMILIKKSTELIYLLFKIIICGRFNKFILNFPKKKAIIISKYIKSSIINSIFENFISPTVEVIEEIAKKNRLFWKEKRFESQ